MTSEQIIEVGKALLPYLRTDLTSEELGKAAFDAVAALNRTAPPADSIEACIKELPEGWTYSLSSFFRGSVLSHKCMSFNAAMVCQANAEGPDPLSAMRAAVEKITK